MWGIVADKVFNVFFILCAALSMMEMSISVQVSVSFSLICD
jgi:hypothetical protein